jgi:hypothetical protein
MISTQIHQDDATYYHLVHLRERSQTFTTMSGFGKKYVQYSDNALLMVQTEARLYDLVFAVWKESHRAPFEDSLEHCFFMPCVGGGDQDGFLDLTGFNVCLTLRFNAKGYFYFVDIY